MYICILSGSWYFRKQYQAEFPEAVIARVEKYKSLADGG